MKRQYGFRPGRSTAIIAVMFLSANLSVVQADNRVHSAGNIRMNMQDNGVIGNINPNAGGSLDDPERPGEWAPQCEFPAGSGVQYLFQGALWIGALIRDEGFEYPRVSVGIDGWVQPENRELFAHPDSRIIERSNIRGARDYLGREIYSPEAKAPQEFITTFYDTLTDTSWVRLDPIDSLHKPLGLKITQKSMVWSEADKADFVIIEWEIENIGDQYLKNIYLGYYIDGDVGSGEEQSWHQDDLTGYKPHGYDVRFMGENDSMVIDSFAINLAYIADNDGRPRNVASGNDFTAPGVSGVMMLDAPNPDLQTSFNWWASNGDPDLDYGPSWEQDGAPGSWTAHYGTPMGDVRKYFLMTNRENDYDAVRAADFEYISAHPQILLDRSNGDSLEVQNWKIPAIDDETPQRLCGEIASGFDAKYLLSWGPLGVFDHVDDIGNRIYRLNPGEHFTVTVAYICAEGFHNPEHPQPENEVIDPDLYDFGDLYSNAGRAIWVNQHILGVSDRDDRSELPATILLSPAFPNPFNSTVILNFKTPFAGIVNCELLDLNGRVWSKFEIPAPGGMGGNSGRFSIDGSGLSAGVYWVKVEQGGETAASRVVLVR